MCPDPGYIAIRRDHHGRLVSGLPSGRRDPLLVFTQCAGDWWRRGADARDHGVRRVIAFRGGGVRRFRALGDICLCHDQSLHVLGRENRADAFCAVSIDFGRGIVGVDHSGFTT